LPVERKLKPGPPVRLFYLDDSGAHQTGFIVYSWLECAVQEWRRGLRCWLDLRKDLYADYRIPPAYELHASTFVNGRCAPSTDPEWNRSKQNRGTVMRRALRTIGECRYLNVGTVYRRTSAGGRDYAAERDGVYHELVRLLDARLAADREFGMVFVDGDGSAASYYKAHRSLKLEHRHLLEDPLFQPSHRSQWVQMADLIAYTAYQHLARIPEKSFAWDWYDTYLVAGDVNGRPIKV
jgi:hypothetical protein